MLKGVTISTWLLFLSWNLPRFSGITLYFLNLLSELCSVMDVGTIIMLSPLRVVELENYLQCRTGAPAILLLHPLFCLHWSFIFLPFVYSEPKPSLPQCWYCQWGNRRHKVKAAATWSLSGVVLCKQIVCSGCCSTSELANEIWDWNCFLLLLKFAIFFCGCALRKRHWNRSAMAPDCFNSWSLFPN